MSEFDSHLDHDRLVEANPAVDRGQLAEAHELVAALRRAGVAAPSYRIDSPYERGAVEGPQALADDVEGESRTALPPVDADSQ